MSRFAPKVPAPTSAPTKPADGPRQTTMPWPVHDLGRLRGQLPWEQLRRGVVERTAPGVMQPKLAVGAIDSPAEREADEMARRFTERRPQRPGGVCSGCGGACCGTGPTTVHRSASDGGTVSPRATSALALPPASGRPLPEPVRAESEAFFGRDLGHVRVHDDGRAAHSARQLRANAFTVGRDIVFGAGRYAPHSSAGRELLAHELTHVLQQGAATALVQRDPEDASVDVAVAPQAPEGPATAHARPQEEPAGPEDDGVVFEGVLLREDPAALRLLLEQWIARAPGGMHEALRYLQRLRGEVQRNDQERARYTEYQRASAYDRGDFSGIPSDPDASPRVGALHRILPTMDRQIAEIQAEAAQVVNEVERSAREVMLSMMAESERIIRIEQARYGITEHQIELARVHVGPDPMDVQTYSSRGVVYRGAVSPESRALGSAASQIARRRAEANAAEHNAIELASHEGMPATALHEAAVDAEQKRRAHDALRTALVAQHPILAAFDDAGPEQLEALARAGSPEAASLLGHQIRERLNAIQTVREHLNRGGGTRVWKLPRVIDAAARRQGVEPGSWRRRFIDAMADQMATVEAIDGVMLGAFVLAMAAITVMSAGSGVAVLAAVSGAGVNTFVAAGRIEDYLLEHAMAHTDLDRAKALSADEPSLLWLALDILGAFADVGALVAAGRAWGVFRRMAPLVRRLEVAATAEEAEELLGAIRRAIPEDASPDDVARILDPLFDTPTFARFSASRLEGALSATASAAGNAIAQLHPAAQREIKRQIRALLGRYGFPTRPQTFINNTVEVRSQARMGPILGALEPSGTMVLRQDQLALLQQYTAKLANGNAILPAEEEAMATLVHEMLHESTFLQRTGAAGIGLPIEEASTELVARRVMRDRLGATSAFSQNPGAGPQLLGRPYDNHIVRIRDRVHTALTAADPAHPLTATMALVEDAALAYKRNGAVLKTPAEVVNAFVDNLPLPNPLNTAAVRQAIKQELLRP